MYAKVTGTVLANANIGNAKADCELSIVAKEVPTVKQEHTEDLVVAAVELFVAIAAAFFAISPMTGKTTSLAEEEVIATVSIFLLLFSVRLLVRDFLITFALVR